MSIIRTQFVTFQHHSKNAGDRPDCLNPGRPLSGTLSGCCPAALRSYFTAPRVSPSTMYFCANMAKISIGTIATMEPAVIPPQSIEA